MKRILIICLLLCFAFAVSGCALFENPDSHEPLFAERLDVIERIELIYYDVEEPKKADAPVNTPIELYDFEKSVVVETLDPSVMAEFLAELDTVEFRRHLATSSATRDVLPASYCFRIVYETGEFDILSFRFNSFMCRYDENGFPLCVEADIYYHNDNIRKLQKIANRFFETPM